MASSDVESPQGFGHINKPLFAITGGFIALFCVSAIVNLEGLSGLVDVGFAWSAKWFGLYWQLLLLATFLIGLALCFFPGAKAKLGGLDEPEFTLFQWGSMIMCTLLAGGGVFWAAGEPMAHFISSPPLFGACPVVLALGFSCLGDSRRADHHDVDVLPLRKRSADVAADAFVSGVR